MLQKEPLQTRNLKIDRRSEQPAEVKDRDNNPSLPLQDVRVSTSYSEHIETSSEALSKPNTTVSGSRTFVEQSAVLDTKGEEFQLNTDFQQELEQLENLILDSVRVPLTELVVIDEGLVLQQIESIRKRIPRELAIAINILQRQQEILNKAEEYTRNSIESANKQAERIIQKSTLIRQAELEATRMKIETERECARLRQETQNEIQQWRELAIADYENVQNGADDYARDVLGNLEGQLSQMLGIIRNGYQQLEPNKVQPKSNHHQ